MYLKLDGPLLLSSNRCPQLNVCWRPYAATDINSIAHQDQQDNKETEMSTVWKFVSRAVKMARCLVVSRDS